MNAQFGDPPPGVFDLPEDESPNKAIDTALKRYLRQLKDDKVPVDIGVKIIAQAIAWEKVKHAIKDKDSEFDPDNM